MNTLINIQHTKKKFKFWKNGDLYLNLSARHTRPSYSSNKRKRIGQQFVTQFDKFGYGDGGGVIRCCCHVRKAICPYSNGQSTQQFGIHLARCDVMIPSPAVSIVFAFFRKKLLGKVHCFNCSLVDAEVPSDWV